ncbi:hypothetical protein FNF27_06221 [Cafeteria roenbergensis]|uniref:RRM domain-containing protein n=1 Tax=Cafeteria roenbergensis TaxID=33653 RepID=A0A5A8E3V0_CAFRO|nr:hypothetical protein FNF27_06221 [Cafeteria roenbergensis]
MQASAAGAGAEIRVATGLCGGSLRGGAPDTSRPLLDHASLTVQHLSPELDELSLGRLFEPFGEIAHVSVSHSSLTRQPSKVGIVQFFEAAAAAAAAKGLNGMSLLGKTMRVSIGGHEAVSSAVPSLAGSATSTNRLFLNPECDDEADSDLDLDAAPLISVHGLSADRLCPSAIVDVIRKARIGALLIPPIDVPVNRIFISNLPPSVTDALVAALFAPFGPVVAVHVMRRFQSTASKGYGFVDMAGGRSAAIRAISALHGTRRADLGMHRALRVEFKCGPCTGGAHQLSGSRVQAGPFRGSDGFPRFSANAGIGRIGGGSGARAGSGQSVYGCSHGAAVAGPFFGGDTGAGTGTQFGRTMAAPAAYGPADHSQHGAAFRRPGMTGHPGVAAAPMAGHGGPSYAQPMLFASRAGMGGNGAGGQSGGFGNNLEHGSDSQRPAGHPSQADNCQERRHPQQPRRHAQSVPSTEGAFWSRL